MTRTTTPPDTADDDEEGEIEREYDLGESGA